jgi:hypothetical protein
MRDDGTFWSLRKIASTGVDSVKSADSFSCTGTIRHPLLLKYKTISSIAQIMSVPARQLIPFRQ